MQRTWQGLDRVYSGEVIRTERRGVYTIEIIRESNGKIIRLSRR